MAELIFAGGVLILRKERASGAATFDSEPKDAEIFTAHLQ